ncbi:hypothetical protein HPB50_009134 [Hyalomma asiaticum]|uniref:Uncharacterized protein n=1 Tax=Hyalomma asiaticum TaxID=266040 RepID=A0ACB7SXB1_HYAAI|nr:hypothetical protein HPB50_009134 [Hyalomma asiaticum]
MSNSSIVAGLLPSLTLEDWEVVVRNVSGGDLPSKLYHANVVATQHTLSVLFDVTRQPATLAFFIFKAVSDVLLGHLKYSSLYRSKSVFRMCRQVVSRHPALSVAAALEQNEEDQEREDAFRQMFAEIVGAILVKAAAILPPQDQRNVSSYLTSLRVLFPTEVYPVQSVPHLSRDYARNLITLFTSGWEFYSYKLPPGITRRISSAALSHGVFVINRNVVIPLVVYSGLRSNGSADDVVGMSAIGVLIADAIWSDILLNRVWSAATTEMVGHYGSCQKNLGTFLPSRFFLFKFPIITISTAQEVARTPQWHEEFPVTELWKSSKCRLFYYMFVRHHYCRVTQGTKKQIAEEVQYITSLSKDFLSAFQCPPPKTPLPTCSMAATP